MPMTLTDTTLSLCECCALVLANGDDRGCRDYYRHTHPAPDVPRHTVLTRESGQPSSGFRCEGCGEHQAPFAYRMWAAVLGEA